MENASTNVRTHVRPAGQRLSEQTASPEQRSQVRVSQSERRPAGVANKSAEKIPGFFERIADRFKDWKESRNEAALKRSGRRAVSTITHGLATGDFKKVYQGLKRLHNAGQKLSQMGGTVGGLNNKTYITDRLKSVVSECLPDEKSNDLDHLKKFAEDRNNLVDRHSDSKTLFHRMLLGLERFDLISSSYVGSRTQRIEAQDKKIKASLQSLGSVSLLEKLANDGNADAMHALGKCYARGKGVDEDFDLAAKWYRKAADAGKAEAMYKLGKCYRDGRGVNKNPEEAFRWFRKAAHRRYSLALSAIHDLGVRYRDGKGVDKSLEKAADMFGQAAGRGYSSALSAIHDLGVRYRDGKGVDKSLEKAADMFRQAAGPGYFFARGELYHLGRCYRDGDGVDKNLEKAADMFRQAAGYGYPWAHFRIYDLGVRYRDGDGVDQDLEKAADMFREAAVHGCSRAKRALDELAQMRRSAGTGID